MNISTQQKLFHWLPVIIWYLFICLLSSIPGNTLSSVPSIILKLMHIPSLSKIPLRVYVFWCHRTCHTVEYGVLGALVIRAYSKEKRVTLATILFLGLLIFLSGAFDEWHQSFVPGRTPALLDAVYDTICGTFGMIAYHLTALAER